VPGLLLSQDILLWGGDDRGVATVAGGVVEWRSLDIPDTGHHEKV
jgi:hypothetical protein